MVDIEATFLPEEWTETTSLLLADLILTTSVVPWWTEAYLALEDEDGLNHLLEILDELRGKLIVVS